MNVLLHIVDRPSQLAALVMITAVAWKRADTLFQGIRIFFVLAFFVAFLATIPVVVIFLVTNGDITLLNVGHVGGWADRLAVSFDLLIPCFLIFAPQLLRRRLTWESASPQLQALLPTWLGLLAAMATAGLVIMLHFVRGGQLAHMRPGLVITAIVGIVLLILPFYSLLARACWQRRYGMVFNPRQWWREQMTAWRMIWGAIRGRGHPAADLGAPPEPDYLGDLLAGLMLRHIDPRQATPLPMLSRLREFTKLDAVTGTGPDEPLTASVDKVLASLGDMVQVTAPAAGGGPATQVT